MIARQPAPGRLSVVEDFVNTLEIDGDARDDRLGGPVELAAWLRERDLLAGGVDLSGADLGRARQVREDLRALLLANNGESLDEGALERLNEIARSTPLYVQFDGPGSAWLEPEARGFEGAVGQVLAIVLGAMADGTWERLKACRNDECTWVFYDASKNHSATWCSMRICGNRMKARAYRRRHAEDRHA